MSIVREYRPAQPPYRDAEKSGLGADSAESPATHAISRGW